MFPTGFCETCGGRWRHIFICIFMTSLRQVCVQTRGWHGSEFSNLSRPTPTKMYLFPSQSHEKTGGKIPSRSTPGWMTPIPSHSRVVVVFLFFLPKSVNYSKNIVGYRSQRAHLISWIKTQNVVVLLLYWTESHFMHSVAQIKFHVNHPC